MPRLQARAAMSPLYQRVSGASLANPFSDGTLDRGPTSRVAVLGQYSIAIYSSIPAHRNWHIETAAWIWPVSFSEL